MSIGSSMRRCLSTHESPGRPPMGTTGRFKGPARRPKEIDVILGYRRAALHAHEIAAARLARAARLRRLALRLLAALALATLLLFGLTRADAPRWPAALRRDVNVACLETVGEPTFCACFTRELERRHPEPRGRVTDEEFRGAINVCRDADGTLRI